ncbi:MAG: amidohydrolase family protein [Bacteroidales bacterium]
MKIDAHQHFWKYNEKEFGWMDHKMESLKRNFLPADLQPELLNAGFEGTIAVQARQNLDETRWLLNLSSQNQFIKGVVGWVDLRSDQLAGQLREFASNPKLVGVRHVIHDEPDDDFMLQPEFLKGIGLLKDFNLTYDILIFPKHLKNTIKFVQKFPDQLFILDHMAKPFVHDKKLSPWKEEITELAKYPNVYCKISGMVTEADWHNWKEEDFKPYLDVVVKSFGMNRLMVGSDWPVCTVAGSYKKVMDIVKNYFSRFPEQEQAHVFGMNAKNLYLKKK